MAVHELFAYLRVRDPERAIAFYRQAFGAGEKFRLVDPDGRIGHAELQVGPAVLMLSAEFPEYGIFAPAADAPTGFGLHLHVDDADAMVAAAVAAGATLVRQPQDYFYGERSGTVRDPFGFEWMIGHSIETVEPAEMQRRYDALGKVGSGG